MTYTPTITVEMAFGYGPLDTPTWTDITAYVRGFTTNRGRGSELEQFSAGTLSLDLDNSEGHFDPDNTSGDYYGDLVPLVPVRVLATYDSVEYPMFYGYVDGWPFDIGGGERHAKCVVTATDAFKILNLFGRVQSPWRLAITATDSGADTLKAWFRFGETTGSRVADSWTGGYDGLLEGQHEDTPGLVNGAQDGALAIDENQPAVRWLSPPAPSSNAFSIECWVKITDDSTEDLEYLVTFAAVTGTPVVELAVQHSSLVEPPHRLFFLSNGGGSVATSPLVKDRAHHVVLTVSASEVRCYLDGVDVTETVEAPGAFTAITRMHVGATPGTAPDHAFVIDELCIWTSTLSAGTVLDHYEAGSTTRSGDTIADRMGWVLDALGWPAGLRDLDAGTVTLGPVEDGLDTDALTYLQSLAETDGGQLFVSRDGKITFRQWTAVLTETVSTSTQATFSNDGADILWVDAQFEKSDREIANDIVVTRDGGEPQSAADASSQSLYGVRTAELSGLLYATDTQSKNRAQRVLVARATPIDRLLALNVEPELSQPPPEYEGYGDAYDDEYTDTY